MISSIRLLSKFTFVMICLGLSFLGSFCGARFASHVGLWPRCGPSGTCGPWARGVLFCFGLGGFFCVVSLRLKPFRTCGPWARGVLRVILYLRTPQAQAFDFDLVIFGVYMFVGFT